MLQGTGLLATALGKEGRASRWPLLWHVKCQMSAGCTQLALVRNFLRPLLLLLLARDRSICWQFRHAGV